MRLVGHPANGTARTGPSGERCAAALVVLLLVGLVVLPVFRLIRTVVAEGDPLRVLAAADTRHSVVNTVVLATVVTLAGGAQLLVRPEWTAMGGPLPGVVLASWFRGPHTDHLLDTPAGEVLVREPGQERHPVGTRLSWDLHRVWPVN
jgi:hypothetical protein